MEQRVSLITLGVADVPRAREFYQQMGWVGQETQETVFIQAGGIAVVLWDREKLALDCGLTDDKAAGFSGIALAHNVRSEGEVDQVIAAAKRAGATVTRPAAKTFYDGYAGYFTDLDGHVWEIAYNPGFPLAEDGSITIPNFRTKHPATDRHPRHMQVGARASEGGARFADARRRSTRPGFFEVAPADTLPA